MRYRLYASVIMLGVFLFFTYFFSHTTAFDYRKDVSESLKVNNTTASSATFFAFDAWDVDIQVKKNNTILVKETWRGEFFEDRHGLYRHIPIVYDRPHALEGVVGKGRLLLDIDVVSVKKEGKPEKYTTKKEDGSKIIIIGDPDTFVSGSFLYELVYRVRHPFMFHETVDELYWNITGTQWNKKIPQVAATIHVPNVKKDVFVVDCYTGRYGAKTKECSYTTENNIVSIAARDFLTASISFPKGIVSEPNSVQRLLKFVRDNWYYYVISLLALAYLVFVVVFWYKKGKDEKGRGVVIPRYTPPKGMSPVDCGALIDGKIHSRDFAAIIVLLAVKGYIQIIEQRKRRFGIPKKVYSLKLIKKIPKHASDVEKKVFRAIFNTAISGVGRVVMLESCKKQIIRSCKEVKNVTFEKLAAGGHFASHPKKIKDRSFSLALFVITLGVCIPYAIGLRDGFYYGGYFLFVTFFVVGSVGLVFSLFMAKRTKKGALAKEHVQGFKLFLETAERYRVQWQEKEHIFETYLPYAMVFGVADKWASVFKDLHKEEMLWYAGAGHLSVAAMTSSIEDFASSVSVITKPKASRSLGSGRLGGGFSGGGRGGGGGGSW